MNIKKIFLILLVLCLLTGCKNINRMDYKEIINNVGSTTSNIHKNGYKYYLPKGLRIYTSGSNYAVIDDNKNYYYIYFDLISYNEKKELELEKKENSIYYEEFSFNDSDSFINISLHNNKYLIEIMCNYAKIEVMVDESDVKRTLFNSISIIKSVKYDSKVIEKMISDNELTYKEEVYDIFEKVNNKKNDYLNYVENSVIEDDNEIIKDTDFLD